MTRIRVTGDIHGNLQALRSVVADGDAPDEWWCVGDMVGYGPLPRECIDAVREMCSVVTAGNHDHGAIGRIDLASFNAFAQAACEWTAGVLRETERDYLGSLPVISGGRAEPLLVHGSPVGPIWEYVLNEWDAAEAFAAFEGRICFNGHSHVPLVFVVDPAGNIERSFPEDGDVVTLSEDLRYIINVGSVGQPRDGDPRACYVVYDDAEATVTYHRVEYPVAEVQEAILEAGLPEFLAQRLAVGR